MEIAWYGHSCFKISERGKATIVTDPFDDSIGYPLPRLKADLVTISHDAPGHNNYDNVKGAEKILGNPGEYEIGGVFIKGVAMHNIEGKRPKWNVAFLFDFDGLTVVHLGDLDHVPHQSVIEQLESVNVALIPVGAGAGMNATQAVELISLLEPDVVIPMHYKTDQSVLELESVDRFLKEMGVSRIQQEEIFKISASGLPDQTQIVLLGMSH